MSEIELRVNATQGTGVRVGQTVHRNQIVGQKADGSGQPYFCPIDGRVLKIDFDGENHEFIITILPD